MTSFTRALARDYGYLAPFFAAAVWGLSVSIGWWAEFLGWVPPRFPASVPPVLAAGCLLLLGLSPVVTALRWPRTGRSLAALAALAGVLALLALLDWWLEGQHPLLAESGNLTLPPALAVVVLLAGVVLAWRPDPRPDSLRPLALAMTGSLAAAYGFTGLIAESVGLQELTEWNAYARIAPSTAAIVFFLGSGLILIAFRGEGAAGEAGPRWLWLPVVVGSVTATLIFWFALRERELSYLNSSTQLTINNVATIFSSETEHQADNINRLAARWGRAGGTPEGEWEKDVAAVLVESPALHSIQQIDSTLRTRWVWPHQGNEDAPFFDHASDRIRRAALDEVRRSLRPAIAAPITSAVQPPGFVVYAPVIRDGQLDGYLAGDLNYSRFFEVIDRQLNLSSRYHLAVEVLHPLAVAGGRENGLLVFSSPRQEARAGERHRQAATFNLSGQRLTIRLVPHSAYIDANRQNLPGWVLFSGLGVSALLGLVVNLAQAAVTRQSAAESTAGQLRRENEERRRIEAQLKTTDERLNLALEATEIGVYEWDIPTGRVFYSPSLWVALGYDPAAMPGTLQTWARLVHPDDLPAARHTIQAHLRGQLPLVESEHRARNARGGWDWIAARAKCVGFDAMGRPLRVIGTCQNITARKLAEETLRASQASSRKLALVASRTDNIVIISDPAGRIEWVNESFTRLTEYTLGEISGRPLLQFITAPDSDPGAPERISLAFQHCEPVTLDVLHYSKSGRRIHLHHELQPVRNDEGRVENFIAIETDVTPRVAAEQQLRRAKAEADSASRAKSDFLASMSHEIRTPMNGVIGMTSLLLETGLTAEQRDYVGTIRASGDALLSVINGILDFSKIESGHLELEHRPFELARCVEEALDIFAVQAADKGIELAYDFDPAVPRWIAGDSTRLRQVLVNLLNNAVKFTERGFITVEVRLASSVPNLPDQRLPLDFFVTDTGIGIPSERLGVLFKPFSQVDSSTTRKYGGTGLGLAICDRLCRLMGGTIDVTSRFGAGSRFRFSIQTQFAVSEDAGPSDPLPAATVLAVDDHPVNRATLAHHLATWGLKPLVAADATEARHLAGKSPPDLLIIDQDLAGASGLELLAQLRAGHPVLPAVLYTPASESARHDSNADPLLVRLPKPIKPSLLHEAIGHLLAGHATPPVIVRPPATASLLAQRLPLAVLIAEDHPINQKVAQLLLERFGYAADTVENGREALAALGRRDYDLVLMDVQMPEMDGLTATREIRARLPGGRQPIIVALTANAMRGDRERCLAAGMDDYISKPVKSENLESVIQRHFGVKPV